MCAKGEGTGQEGKPIQGYFTEWAPVQMTV